MNIRNWDGVLPNLTRTRIEGEYGSAVGYRILRNERGHIWVSLQELLIQTGNRVGQEVTDLYNEGQTAEYTVRFSKFLKPEVETQRKLFPGKVPVSSQSKMLGSTLWENCGLSFEEQRAAVEKAIQIAGKALFSTNLVIKKYCDLEDKLSSLGKGILENYMVGAGAVVKDAWLPGRYASLNRIEVNCVTFVFLYLQDLDFIKDWKKEVAVHALHDGQHVEVLKKWQYRPVAVPKEGDLVIYISNLVECDPVTKMPSSKVVQHFKHIGIYQGNGRVLSKNGGTLYPKIYEHDLDNIPSDYGNLIRFYRKIKPAS